MAAIAAADGGVKRKFAGEATFSSFSARTVSQASLLQSSPLKVSPQIQLASISSLSGSSRSGVRFTTHSPRSNNLESPSFLALLLQLLMQNTVLQSRPPNCGSPGFLSQSHTPPVLHVPCPEQLTLQMPSTFLKLSAQGQAICPQFSPDQPSLQLHLPVGTLPAADIHADVPMHSPRGLGFLEVASGHC